MHRRRWATSLYWKGMLAFLLVILAAVGTVALLSGWITTIEFRRYAITQTGRWTQQVATLGAYYSEYGSWDGIEKVLQSSEGQGSGRQARGQGRGAGAGGRSPLAYNVADAEGRIVAHTADDQGAGTDARVAADELQAAGIPILADGQIVGYLLPAVHVLGQSTVVLDASQTEFLSRVRTALTIGAVAAVGAAFLIGGLLFRSIVGPLRQLTAASQAIARGDLTVRAPVRGQDEVATLATSFNRMADALDRAENARRNQVADVAHELRTPLTVVQGVLEAMLDGIYPTDKKNLSAALAQVRTLGRLVEDLGVLALADAGHLHLRTAPTDVGTLLRQTAALYEPRAEKRNVTLRLEVPPGLPAVRADPDRLTQVIANLVENALRYVPEGGAVTLGATAHPGEVEVSVQDDGPGVPAGDLPHLFDRFWRGDRARGRVSGGSGLGLAIARSLTEAHGGRIWAESVEGEGSTFAFALPT